MKVPILLTPEVKATMPETIKVLFNFGHTQVRFPAIENNANPLMLIGDNAVVEGNKEDIIKWLKPFDGVAIGGESPQLEQFTIMHIDKNL
jgi:hypothetical protein